MKSFLQWLVKRYIWIAICAIMAAYTTHMVTGQVVAVPLLLLLFFATIAEYSIDAYTLPLLLERSFADLRQRDWLFIISLPISVACFFLLTVAQQLFFLHLAVLAVGYTLPIFGKPLREVPYLKMWLIVYAWVGCVFVVPLLDSLWHFETYTQLLERICFFLSIAISFDVRDITKDQKKNVITLANRLGENGSQQLSLAAAIVGAILSISLYPPEVAVAMVVSYALAYGLVAKVKPGQKNFFSNFFVDGTLVFQALLLWLALLLS